MRNLAALCAAVFGYPKGGGVKPHGRAKINVAISFIYGLVEKCKVGVILTSSGHFDNNFKKCLAFGCNFCFKVTSLFKTAEVDSH